MSEAATAVINDWHRAALKHSGVGVEPIECADGFSMSVQASRFHYCSPREDGAWPYHSFEIGFPSAAEPLIAEYASDADDPTETVYGWVPATVVDAVIAKHGGIKTEGQS